MRILLMRHGAAVSYGVAERDEDRWLTAEGRLSVQRATSLLRDEGFALDAIYTSPLVRAVQTAELVADGLGCANVLTHAPMAPDRGGVDAALGALARLHATDDFTALVGHEPKIRSISQRLGGGVAAAGFSTAEVRLFESAHSGYRLVLTIDAQGLRRV